MRRLLAALLVMGLAACSGPAADEELPGSSSEGESRESPTDESSDVTLTIDSTEAEAVVEHLKAQGLPIGRYDAYSAETSPFKPLTGSHLYETMVIFSDTRIEPVLLPESEVLKFDESGGIIETFASRDDLRARAAQIDAVRSLADEQGVDLESEYQIRQGNILLRLGHVMEEWTGEYEAALASYQG